MKNTVIIYQDGLLSYSETFIKKQSLALKAWRPVLVGHKFIKKGLSLEPLTAQLLIPEKTNLLRRALYFFNRWRNKADPIGVATLAKLKAKLIHAHFGTSAVDIWPYAKALNLPLLVTLHGFDINIYKEHWETGKRGKRKRHYPQQLLALAHEPNVHFLAVSTAIKKRAMAFGIPAEKITISYIGVDTEDFTTPAEPVANRKNRVLYVGRLVEKKGASYLLEAFIKVKAVIADTELIIVGRGPLEEALKQQVSDLKLDDVCFMGALSNQDVKQQIDQCKVFCLPSITAKNGDAEGLPISILEAQASGVFVVSSSSGGVGDNLIHGKTCYTFSEKDSDQLTEILIDILRNPTNHFSILEQQKQLIAEKFQLKNCAIELEKIYQQYAHS